MRLPTAGRTVLIASYVLTQLPAGQSLPTSRKADKRLTTTPANDETATNNPIIVRDNYLENSTVEHKKGNLVKE